MPDKIHIHLTLTEQEAKWLAYALGVGSLSDEGSDPPWQPLLIRVEDQIWRNIRKYRKDHKNGKTNRSRPRPRMGKIL